MCCASKATSKHIFHKSLFIVSDYSNQESLQVEAYSFCLLKCCIFLSILQYDNNLKSILRYGITEVS